jgi:hypothetical protein
MQAKPIVSVVIPAYNHATYLSHAIRSVLRQTYPQWEAIIVDDGSTDDTESVVAQHLDPRICYIYQENQGLSSARNTGIRAASGEYLSFLDADDEWEPTFLECCRRVLERDGRVAGVYTRNRFIDARGQVLPRLGGQVVTVEQFQGRLLREAFFPVHSVLVQAACVREAGMFDETLTSLEDWDLWLRIAEHHMFRGIPDPLARYRVYPGSMSTNVAQMHINRVAVLTKYFGPPDGDVETWTEEKRKAYGFAYRSTALGYLEQAHTEECWDYLAKAVAVWPQLLGRLDTFYELACGDQPRGNRGQADSLDIKGNGVELVNRLNVLFLEVETVPDVLRRTAYGNAYLALVILSDLADQWSMARCYLLKAAASNPGLVVSHSVVRRLLKLCAGRHVVEILRRLFGRRPHPVLRETTLPLEE